ncbi:MAG: hypothetical protein ACRD1T_19720 [Acidimicrobiia bacterium]
MLQEALIGGVVARSALIQGRLKNRVIRISPSVTTIPGLGTEAYAASKSQCLEEHVPIRAKDLACSPSDSALNDEEALLRYLREAGTVGVESPVHKRPPVIGYVGFWSMRLPARGHHVRSRKMNGVTRPCPS